jgi:hypothetical protein
VEIVLALPLGFADVEDRFSIMNHVQYYRQSRLSTKHIENIIKICINGPDVEYFNVQPYTLHRLENHIEPDSTIKKSTFNAKTEMKGSKLF